MIYLFFMFQSAHRMKILMMLVNLVLICYECRGEDKVDQPDKQISESEESITLHCKYKTASNQPELFWYIQRVNDFPKYILRRNTYGAGDNGTEFQERFQSEVKSDSVSLIIHDVHGHMRTEVSSSISSCREK